VLDVAIRRLICVSNAGVLLGHLQAVGRGRGRNGPEYAGSRGVPIVYEASSKMLEL